METTTPTSNGKSFTRFFPTIARYLLGLPLLVFGLNAFFNFIPQPTTPMPEGAAAFAGALFKSGYMMQLIGVTFTWLGDRCRARAKAPSAASSWAWVTPWPT